MFSKKPVRQDFSEFLAYDFTAYFGGVMTEIEKLPRATFTSFADSTKEDWDLIMSQRGELETALPNRILDQLELLRNDYGGFPVDRLEHSVQTATRA